MSRSRLEIFDSLADHIIYGPWYRQLNASELEWCHTFLRSTEVRPQGPFAETVARLFLDNEKPKHFSQMHSLLSATASISYREFKDRPKVLRKDCTAVIHSNVCGCVDE